MGICLPPALSKEIHPTLEIMLIKMPTGLLGYDEVMEIMKATPKSIYGLKYPQSLPFRNGEHWLSYLSFYSTTCPFISLEPSSMLYSSSLIGLRLAYLEGCSVSLFLHKFPLPVIPMYALSRYLRKQRQWLFFSFNNCLRDKRYLSVRQRIHLIFCSHIPIAVTNGKLKKKYLKIRGTVWR